MQNSTCFALLWILPCKLSFHILDFHYLWYTFPSVSTTFVKSISQSKPRLRRILFGLGSSCFARHYFRNRVFFLFLQVLRCFSSLRSLPMYYFTHTWINQLLPDLSSLIRISMGRWIFAPYHSFSQLITSFFGSWCLGILPTLFVA